ncbi:hypothetical protein COCNU_scaffold005650G000070 [Cocos nucifera]|nr:hypothetical protein [Cocos nucifera]
MVQKALMEHGGEEGLTADEINEYLIAANYHLPPHHGSLFPSHLNQLTQRNNIIRDPSSGRYTIPGRAEVRILGSQAEEVLCKLKKAEDKYIKNLAGPFVKDFHLSKIKKLKSILDEATTSSGHGEFKKPSWTPGDFKKPALTHADFKKPALTHGEFKEPTLNHGSQARSVLATAGEMSPDPGHGGPGPTAEQGGDERPDQIVNPAGNVSVRDLGLHPRRRSPGCPTPMGTRPNRPGSEAPGSASGSFKIPKNAHALQTQQGRGGSDNPVGIGGPAVSQSGPIEPSRAALQRPPCKPGKWAKRKTQCGKVTVWIKLPGSERK